MKKFYVYVHVLPNGKRYVGITTASKPERRWGKNGERYEHQLFGKAVRKYGWDNITHDVFEVDSAEEMYRKEVELISFYHTNDPRYGYNISIGGEKGALGCKHSEESRKKQSEDNLKRWADPEYKERVSKGLKKKWTDPEYRRKISETLKKRCSDPEVRRKRSEVQKKVHSDPEIRRKISETLKSKPRIKIKLPDGTILEMTKQTLTRWYVNKGKKFEYLSY